MEGIFNELVVVELASVLAGPAVGMFMAELGARVIKVEHFRSGGDVTRSWKSEKEGPGDRSAYFSAVNWGKESIGVDLRTPEGKQVIYDLAKNADVVIASYKPGDAEKLGMDAATLMELHPALIYADLSAYGDTDHRVGFDAIIQAESGFTYMNGTPESGPVKMPVALMDLLAAHQLKEGILLALYHRLRTGEGRHVQTSLIGAGLASLANQATNWLVGGKVPQRIGSEHPNIVPYGTIYPTRDGKDVVLAVGNDLQFLRLCECLGIPEWATDPRYAMNPARVQHRRELNEALAVRIAARDREELLIALHAAKVPAGAVRDMPAVFELPQAQQMLLEGEGLRGVRSVALEGFGGKELHPPPHLATATASVLRELAGYSAAQIQILVEKVAIAPE